MSDQTPFAALRQLVRDATQAAEEQCDLCSQPIPVEHRHLLNLSSREIQCVCQACRILFDRRAAGGGTLKLIPTRYLRLNTFQLTDAEWTGLHLPVDMVFITNNTLAGRVMAMYPGPMGPTESLLSLETWGDMEKRNPILKEMEPDVEALLVNRVRGAREYFLVPIDECYKLVGLIRLHWRGLTGGQEVWKEINAFFAALKRHVPSSGEDDA